MRPKEQVFSNFTNSLQTHSTCFRPDNEKELEVLSAELAGKSILARGLGLSYSDCCLNDKAIIIDTSRLNHLISFDKESGLLICQGHVSFADLFLLDPDYIPPVIPGTLRATVAGGIANDVHGKNNHEAGTLGNHLEWIELQIGKESFHCSLKKNKDLFLATIGGLGLTGIIKRVALRMHKATHFVQSHKKHYSSLAPLLSFMQQEGLQYDYQVAWLDLLNKPRGILSLANHCEPAKKKNLFKFTIPKLPFSLIRRGLMKGFNRVYFKMQREKQKTLALIQFNNPLDAISQWNNLYGQKGLVQFQAVFAKEKALATMNECIELIKKSKALPTLAVLKYFAQSGRGPLSFAEPGFTLAIDFKNNEASKKAILEMNEWITKQGGKIYLAKDLYLNQKQFEQQYPKHQEFSKILNAYQSSISSNLSRRLGISHE